MRLLFLLFAYLSLGAADWKAIGTGSTPRGNTYIFMDAESVKSGGSYCTIWTKSILQDSVDTLAKGNKAMERAAMDRCLAGYIPAAISQMKPKDEDARIAVMLGITMWEIAANSGELTSDGSILYEVNFDEGTYRTLNISMISRDGRRISTDKMTELQYISPEQDYWKGMQDVLKQQRKKNTE